MNYTTTKENVSIILWSYLVIKRLFDIIVGLLGILLLIPVSIIVKIVNLINKDYAPMFYSHTRIGKNGKEFKLYKFRSMVPNADEVLKELMKDKKIGFGDDFNFVKEDVLNIFSIASPQSKTIKLE